MDGAAHGRTQGSAAKDKKNPGSDQRQRPADQQVSGPHLGRIKRFTTIGANEKRYVLRALSKPLSGYIGGVRGGGYWVERLAAEWQETFNVRYAIPCNSATSGLLAACMAAGIKSGSEVWTTPYSMSATAACAQVLGARVYFGDIENWTFGLRKMPRFRERMSPDAIIVTNLFGHPADVESIRDASGYIIEDNAQAPFAKAFGQYAGTIGHVGVFSLNIHKHIQCGEGGVVVTNDEVLAHRLNHAINHGEIDESEPALRPGLNLRMTEPTAAIACAQLAKAGGIIESRIQIALELTDMVRDIPWIVPPEAMPECRHVYYLWAARILGGRRKAFVEFLQDHGFPIRAGYSPLLHRVFGTDDECPVAEQVEDHEIVVYENCAWDPTSEHLRRMRRIIQAAEALS